MDWQQDAGKQTERWIKLADTERSKAGEMQGSDSLKQAQAAAAYQKQAEAGAGNGRVPGDEADGTMPQDSAMAQDGSMQEDSTMPQDSGMQEEMGMAEDTDMPEEMDADGSGDMGQADGSMEGMDPDPAESKKGRFFGRKKEDKKEKQLMEQIEQLNDRLIRQMAEFDNFRKRTEKEKSTMFEVGAKDIIERILPVVDNFERGLGAVGEEEKDSAFVQGIEKIYKQLMTVLDEAGVKPIEAVGKEFDPNFHNAVMHAEDEELGENIVAEEFQKGYMYRESVVRHSMVKVVN